jgi:tetratricopeptide (TPR) repeat protein
LQNFFAVAEHWFYLPMVGLLGLIGVLINELSQKKRPIVYVLLVIVIIALGTRTYYRNIDWQDQYRLLLTDYPHSPDSYDIESNIGYELSHRGKIKEAIVYFKKATESAPSYPIGWYNLGTAYESLGDYSQALKYYTIAQKGQGFYLAYERYAYTLIKLNQHDKAKLFLTKTAIPKFPYNEKLKTILKQVDTAVPQQ